jgi:hypothetical protein
MVNVEHLYHSSYDTHNNILYGTHKSGFYSCINEVRNSLYRLISEKKYPLQISFELTLDWYKDGGDIYPLLYKTNYDKINNLYNLNFSFEYFCPTALNLPKLFFSKIKLIEETYFSPSDIVLNNIEELEQKYKIDYNNTLAVLHRGTDKHCEAALASIEDWISHIESVNDKDYNILIQTDDIIYKEAFLKKFPKAFVFDEMIFNNQYVRPNTNKNKWSINFESIMRIISKCDKIITHSGNVGVIPVIYKGNLKNVSQCFNDGKFKFFNKKIISYCVFGDNPIFTKGAIENARLGNEIYKDWISRFYLFEECHHLEKELLSYPNVEVVKINKRGNFYSTLYRFLPLGENDVSYFISRDTDSRLSIREKEAVDAWIQSNKDYHIMKDHPYHYTPLFPILAGMWGSKGGLIPNIKELMSEFISKKEDKKGVDQEFLHHFYHNYVKDNVLEHNTDNFPSSRNFERDKNYFIGQPFDENNNFYGDWKNDLAQIGII